MFYVFNTIINKFFDKKVENDLLITNDKDLMWVEYMNYIGKIVSHIKWGKGTIVNQNDDKIHVQFVNLDEEKVFKVPDCFKQFLHILDDKIRLLSVLENHGFEGFHHYTDFKNFLKIFERKKLYSRAEAENKKVLINDAAQKTIIDKTPQSIKDKVRFYYMENTPTLCRNMGIRHVDDFAQDDYGAHMPIPVLLLFKKELLLEKDVNVSSGGCGSFLTKITSSFEEALLYDWDEIFKREPIRNVTDAERKVIRNKRNAEFLFPKAVGLDSLKAVVFRSEADKKHAEFILGKNNLFRVDLNKFMTQYYETSERNFLKDYRVVEHGENKEVELEFYKSPMNYNHIIKQYFSDGHIEAKTIGHLCSDSYFIRFSYNERDDFDRVEYLLNNEVSAIWR